jgi:putative aldouronate transport system substrate-binding protein
LVLSKDKIGTYLKLPLFYKYKFRGNIMKSKRLFCLVATAVLTMSMLSGCKKDPAEAPAPVDSKTETTDSGKLEPYTFTHYFNYDWWDIKPWAVDEVSKTLKEKFNVTVEFSKPDQDPQAKLNVMISSGDLPDSIMMDRGVDNIKLADLGLLQPLEPLMEKNPAVKDNLLPTTMKLLSIKDKLYGIPNWPRTAATGGNNAWVTNDKLYKAAGSPKLETFEDLYNFAKKIKAEFPKTDKGLPTVPMTFDASADGNLIMEAFYRSFGGVQNGWYGAMRGNYELVLKDPVYKEAAMEVNKWWREGLLSETQFTDTGEQILEKIVAGRTALMYYDESKDETNKFRKILKEAEPDNGYEMVSPFPFPPAKGLTKDKIYGDITSTVGWNVTCITKNAKDPQRIYDLWSYLLTPEAAILQMYGPKGQNWDELDANGLPKLKKAESELTADEINKLGAWFWMIPGHSDHVDNMKFAVNAAQPKEKQNWVINNQANVLTPTKVLSDEFVGIGEVIDSKSDEGIKRTLIEDKIKAEFPKVLMAKSAEEASKIYDEIIAFADKNGMTKIEELYNAKYQENVKTVGTALKK